MYYSYLEAETPSPAGHILHFEWQVLLLSKKHLRIDSLFFYPPVFIITALSQFSVACYRWGRLSLRRHGCCRWLVLIQSCSRPCLLFISVAFIFANSHFLLNVRMYECSRVHIPQSLTKLEQYLLMDLFIFWSSESSDEHLILYSSTLQVL